MDGTNYATLVDDMISLIFEIQGSPFCGLETQKTSAGDPNAMLTLFLQKVLKK